MLTRARFTLTLLLAAILLAGCVIPVEYNLNILVHDDGAYTLTYDGTASLPSLRATQLAGDEDVSNEDLAELRAALREEPAIKTFKYEGKGIFKGVIEQTYSNTSTETFFGNPFVTVERTANTITFTIPPVAEAFQSDYDQFQLEHNGHVTLRTSNQIIESNGKRGLRGHYWDNNLLKSEGLHLTIRTPSQ